MNRLLGTQALDCGTLMSERRTENPFPAEAALIAHCIIDPDRIDQIETINVTPPCATLLDIVSDFKGVVRAVGLASVVLRMYDPSQWTSTELAADVTRTKPILEHIDVYDLAMLVDSIRVVELVAIGSFELTVAMMGGRLKPAEPGKKKTTRFGKATTAEIAGLAP